MPSTMPVSVPGGFAREDGWRRTLHLRGLTGWDEMGLRGGAPAPPATLATRLLSTCVFLDEDTGPVGPDFVRALTVGDREALLLQLRAVSVGDALPCVLDCPACGEPMELELRVTDLLMAPYGYEGPYHTLHVDGGEAAGAMLRFRLPSGGDQEAVAPLAHTDPERAARAIAARCLVAADGGPPPPAETLAPPVLDSLSRRMAELDPQSEILLRLACPACGEECRTIFDTLQYLEVELDRARSRLAGEIHLLAYHYHWSESDILAMPGTRRRRYAEHLADAMRTRGAS